MKYLILFEAMPQIMNAVPLGTTAFFALWGIEHQSIIIKMAMPVN